MLFEYLKFAKIKLLFFYLFFIIFLLFKKFTQNIRVAHKTWKGQLWFSMVKLKRWSFIPESSTKNECGNVRRIRPLTSKSYAWGDWWFYVESERRPEFRWRASYDANRRSWRESLTIIRRGCTQESFPDPAKGRTVALSLVSPKRYH